jgi:cytochrome c5
VRLLIGQMHGLLVLACISLWNHSTFSASHHPQEFLNQIAGKSDEGEQIVQHFCSNCHAVKPLIPLGAPRIGSVSDWGNRIKQGHSILLQHTMDGYGAMPARGGCFECSDEQLMLSIMAMLPQTNKHNKKPKR